MIRAAGGWVGSTLGPDWDGGASIILTSPAGVTALTGRGEGNGSAEGLCGTEDGGGIAEGALGGPSCVFRRLLGPGVAEDSGRTDD